MLDMTYSDGGASAASGEALANVTLVPVIVATNFRESGRTGVHTHFREVSRYLEQCGAVVTVISPFSWGRPLTYPVFAPRLALRLFSKPASVIWYLHWHEVFLYNALRRHLAEVSDCVVYAQGPLEARGGTARAARTPPTRGDGCPFPCVPGR